MSTNPSSLASQPAPAPAPETSQSAPSQQPAAEPQSAPQQPTVNQADRQAIYQRYYGSQASQEPAQQATAPEPAAQAEPNAQEPAAEPTQATLPPDPQQDRLSQLETQFSQVVQILEKLAQPQQPEPVAAPGATEPPPSWVELVRQGKIEDAEKALFSKFESKLKTETTSEALEMFRVETEVNGFLSDLRAKNPDLVSFEDLIGVKAQAHLEAEFAGGKIHNTAAYLDAYKRAVNSAVADARNLVQQIRAAGKNEALTVKQEVLSSSPIAPNGVDQNRGALPNKGGQPPPQTAQDYIAQRQASAARRAGLLTT